MSPRTGQHRRTAPPPAAAPIRELRRCRVELTEMAAELAAVTAERDQLRAMLADPNPLADPDYWQDVYRESGEAYAAERYAAGIDVGRGIEAAARDRAWHEAADPIANGGPAWAELEKLRWGPGGRQAFGAPRATDYRGGVVMWDAPAGQAVAS